MSLVMYDGGFTTMAPAPPLTLAFFGGPAVAVAFVLAEKDAADVEKGVLVEREVRCRGDKGDVGEIWGGRPRRARGECARASPYPNPNLDPNPSPSPNPNPSPNPYRRRMMLVGDVAAVGLVDVPG